MISNPTTFKNAQEAMASCLVNLQETYTALLNTDQTEAYEDVGLTLRTYAESLALMGGSTTEEEAFDDD